jgi:hypothetical protein
MINFISIISSANYHLVYSRLYAITSASHRTDSPVLLIFPRRLSGPVTPMASIAEQPQTFLYSATIDSLKLTETGHPYTFLDSSSSGNSSPANSSSSPKTAFPPLSHERFPPCLNLQNLGYEDDFDTNDSDEGAEWSEGWNISSSSMTGQASQDTRPLYQPELPEIEEYAFAYYPEPAMNRWGDDSVKVARRRLVRKRKGERHGRKFKAWVKKVIGKLRSGRRR